MSMNTTEMIDIAPEKLNYGKPLGLLSDVARREDFNLLPVGGKTGNFNFFGDGKIEFQFTDNEAIDWTTSALKIKVNLVDGSGDHQSDARIYGAHEIFEYIELYHDSEELVVSSNRTSRVINNIILHQEANQDYIETEADIFTGLRTQFINSSGRTSGAINNQEFIIPMFYFHPFFAQQQAHPVLGSRIRLVFHLAQPNSFMAPYASGDTCIVNDVKLMTTRLVMTPSKKAELMASVKTGDGIVLSYPDFQENKVNPARGATESHTIKNDFNNAISLYAYTLYQPGTAQLIHPQTNVSLAKRISRLDVRCGSRSFTYGSEGARSLLELYKLYEACSNALSNITGQGTVKYSAYNANPSPSSNPPFSPVCVSLERYSVPDSQIQILDSGLSALDEGANADIHVQMSMGTNVAATEDLYLTLVYQRMMVWNARGITTLR
jgi:hypothetical protein